MCAGEGSGSEGRLVTVAETKAPVDEHQVRFGQRRRQGVEVLRSLSAKRALRVVDLFAGARLLSYAFRREGFEVSLAVEKDPRAAETYRRNLGEHVVCADVARVVPRGECDVLVGGTPCQGFSTLGKRRPDDPRNNLAMAFVPWAARLKPKVIVIENVEPFSGAPIWGQLARGLERLGYVVSVVCLNAVEFGAAQRCRRSFTIGSAIGDIPIRAWLATRWCPVIL